MARVSIDVGFCKGCELCIPFCPHDSLTMSRHLNEHGLPTVYFKEDHPCSGCRYCAVMCPEAAIEIFK
ncbi:MAG: 4Fe-4S dicluster domain-containing protein [Candidatus Brocadiaceae bacterium]|nr:4Fe-4S dicluster domain-containing protein [Candidatus Brocadiaceae bacterium]